MLPQITVVTPTIPSRNEHLRRLSESIRRQDYAGPIEHIIVSDGWNENWLLNFQMIQRGNLPSVHERRYECGWNTTNFFKDSYAIGPLLVGTLLCSSDFITWVADDDYMLPQHLRVLYEALTENDVEFAYPIVKMLYVNSDHISYAGQAVPSEGNIGTFLARRELLQKGMWQFGEQYLSDWCLVHRWLVAGTSCVFVPEVTFHHYVDH